MLLTKSISIDLETVRELLNAIVSVSVTANSKLTKEQCYSTYILRQLYMKLRTKENRILDLGKTKGKIKIDSVQALVLVDVLQYCHQTLRLSSFLMDIGTILPIVFKSI